MGANAWFELCRQVSMKLCFATPTERPDFNWGTAEISVISIPFERTGSLSVMKSHPLHDRHSSQTVERTGSRFSEAIRAFETLAMFFTIGVFLVSTSLLQHSTVRRPPTSALYSRVYKIQMSPEQMIRAARTD